MVLLLQHNYFVFVLFNKFLFLLGNSNIQVFKYVHLTEQTGLLNRGILAILTVRLIVTNLWADCVELQRTHRGVGLHNKVQMKLKAESKTPAPRLHLMLGSHCPPPV